MSDHEAMAQLLASQKRVLEMIATDQNLEETLAVLIAMIEQQYREIMASIWLLDETGQSFQPSVAVTLPQEYIKAIAPQFLAESGMYWQEVIIPDIAKTPFWRDYRSLALNYNLRSYWSIPIFSSQEELLGIFALYAQQPRLPNDEDRHFVEFATYLAGVAIEQKKSRVATHRAEEKYRDIFENIAVGIFQTTPDGHYISANPALAAIYGYDCPEALIADLTNIRHQLYVDPERRSQLIQLLQQNDTVSNFESQVYCRDGSMIWIVEDTRAVRDETGKLLYYEGTVQDITAKRIAEEKLLYSAMHDALTCLPNRVCFTHRLENAIAQSHTHPQTYRYAVLFLDLDRFKVVNDSLGHLVGDALLKAVAQRLQRHLEKNCTIARLGGDEFALLLEHINGLEDAIAVARSIQTLLYLPFQLEHYEVFTGTSIGIVLGNSHYTQPETLLRDADVAMYRAKAKGRGQYAVFNPLMQIHACERLQLENDLRWGLDRQEFFLYYQPIVSLATGALKGFEVLIRWRHPQRGIISPTEFIPVAEETGLIHILGMWILQQSCQQLLQWQQENPDLLLHVNLSPIQLKQVDFVEQITHLCEKTGVSPQGLQLEVTESCLLEAETLQGDRLKALKSLGFGLCIDDFGIGYSSLSRLHEYPIDTVKIDRSFVQGLDVHTSKTEIVETIVTLAHRLGMTLVAEGVETQKQVQLLQQLGCEFAQGYLYSPAVSTVQATNFVQGKCDY
ncbi:EAL domain-containing protein [Spirulina sp. CS-785/01]|uniref:sensor domain-containing phosphodiesterase n=1 Tax=Spirulina sp. CS-785/01 TaxID=3021716 RepID=UPI00232BCB2F|nr:EAL domain-containing protein [Spirulina sp. CS-785/01]MDB9313086.1 EAL domain-containing protein [Spirulina sp. CS-785/01]